MIIGARRAPDAETSIQLGDIVRWRPGALSRRWHRGQVTGWLKGGLVVTCQDGIARRCPVNAAERV